MDNIADILLKLDLAQLAAIGVMMWFFYSRLNNKIEKLDIKLDTQISNLSAKIDKLDEKVTDIDRRVCRMEGAFNNKECCMIKDSIQLKKIE